MAANQLAASRWNVRGFSHEWGAKILLVKTSFSALILVISLIFSEELPGVLGEQTTVVMWLGLAVLIMGIFSGRSVAREVPAYAERHFEFSRVLDENPWMKIFYVICGMVVAVGGYFVISDRIEIGVYRFFGVLLLLMMPIFIYKIRLAYVEAGNERE